MSPGMRLKLALDELGVKQKTFADEIGITPAGLSDIIAGRAKNITKPLLFIISAKFNISENWLLTGEGDMFRPKLNPEDVAASMDRSRRLVREIRKREGMEELLEAIFRTDETTWKKIRDVVKVMLGIG